jgi:ATP-dependent protease ClpP protease subunit
MVNPSRKNNYKKPMPDPKTFFRTVNYKGGKINVVFDKAAETPVELMIYEDIGNDPFGGEGFTAKDFMEAVKDIPNTRPLDLRINSAGGQVWEGLAIKTRIDEWKGRKTASIDGMAASVASWLPMSVDEIRAPRHAQMFIHDAWGFCMGNSADMVQQAAELEKTSDQIAGMYSVKTKMPISECRDLMKAGTLFTAEEANKMGFIDRLTNEEPVQNFSALQIRNMRARLAVLNSIKHPLDRADNKKTEQENMKKKIALLNKWGIPVPKGATEAQLDKLISLGKLDPKNAVKFKEGKSGPHAADCDCADCASKNDADTDGDDGDEEVKPKKNAPEPDAEHPDPDAADGAHKSDEGKLFKAATANLKRMENFLAKQRKTTIQSSLDKLVIEGRLTANAAADWLSIAVATEDESSGENPIVNKLAKMPVIEVGITPVDIKVGESDSVEELGKNVTALLKPQNYFSRNGTAAETLQDRMMIGQNSKRVSQLINRFKQYDSKKMVNGLSEMIGPLRAMYDQFVVSPRNANAMATGLLRQVILSEVMRAFRRQFTSLTYFAHNFGNVPLEGTDVVQVPYYPLDTTASSEFTYSAGYTITPAATTSSKSITVGGVGNGTASAGSGRKYKALAFTAYEIRRQPWLDIQKLSVMAGEQLAVDVRADIIGTQINATNFGNAVWTGNAGGFTHDIISTVLFNYAIKAYWPKAGRNIVVAPGYFTNLVNDPMLFPYLYSGGTDILNEGIIQNKFGFENILYDALLPVATYIRGGDGSVTAGGDLNLAGYMCWPSAVLIATAPIMPPPGVLKKLVAYEQITDDQTNLAFTYQFFGEETKNRDSEIIECTYGSGLGELAALARITSSGV